MLISFELRHLEDQPVTVHLYGGYLYSGIKPPERVEPVHHFQGRNPSLAIGRDVPPLESLVLFARRHSHENLVALLRDNADFRRLFCASALSLTGDWFTFVALSSFVYHRTGSAGWTALLFAVNSLPGVVLLPLIGSLTDRFDRQRLRILCDLGAIVPVVGLLAAFHTQ